MGPCPWSRVLALRWGLFQFCERCALALASPGSDNVCPARVPEGKSGEGKGERRHWVWAMTRGFWSLQRTDSASHLRPFMIDFWPIHLWSSWTLQLGCDVLYDMQVFSKSNNQIRMLRCRTCIRLIRYPVRFSCCMASKETYVKIIRAVFQESTASLNCKLQLTALNYTHKESQQNSRNHKKEVSFFCCFFQIDRKLLSSSPRRTIPLPQRTWSFGPPRCGTPWYPIYGTP